jgi:YjbE family integral membrane protein
VAAVTDLFTSEAVVAFIQVVAIDLVLAGDNAVVIGLAAAGLPTEQRTRAILIGIVGATALRIVFAGLTTQLLQIVGLLFAGGILLLWVCWKIWRELRTITDLDGVATQGDWDINRDGTIAGRARRKTFGQAALQIVAADVSMSLDNVLAVAGGSIRSYSYSAWSSPSP